MAILPPLASTHISDTIEYFDSIVESKGIVITHVSRDQFVQMPESAIKAELAHKLATAIIENQLCEFTKVPDLNNMSTVYRVRAYLTPKEQCKIIRQAKQITKQIKMI